MRDLLKKNTGNSSKISSEKQFQDMVRHHRDKAAGQGMVDRTALKKVKVTHFNLKRIGYIFCDEAFDVSFLGIFFLSFIVGIVGGIYGIGGSIIAPFFVTFFGLPVYTVAGAALMGTFVTSVAGLSSTFGY